MIKALLTALILAGTGLSAMAAEGDFCAGVRCTAKMQEIAAEFQTYRKFPSEPMAVAYSGSCYMLEGSLNPEVEQHGMFLFETAGGYTSGSGSHSYYSKENPWAGWTFDQIKARQQQLGTKYNPIIVTASEATLSYDYSAQDNPVKINHFFRTSDDEANMIWLTEWIFPGGVKRVYCKLERNPSHIP